MITNWFKLKSQLSPTTHISVLLTVALLVFALPSSGANAPKPGAKCPRAGKVEIANGVRFTCIKTSGRLIWDKGAKVSKKSLANSSVRKTSVATPGPTTTPVAVQASPIFSAESTNSKVVVDSVTTTTSDSSIVVTQNPNTVSFASSAPSPAFTPALAPTTFENLYERRSGVRYAAWSKVSEAINKNVPSLDSLEVLTGPSSKPYFGDFELAAKLVTRAFPNHEKPAKTIVMRFNFDDVSWAEEKLKSLLTLDDWQSINRWGNPITNQCDFNTKNCNRGEHAFTRTKISIILLGISNQIDPSDPTAYARNYEGMVEAHEFFHGVQLLPMTRKTSGDWPPSWFREGGAEWTQNAVINHADFNKYETFITLDCSECLRYSAEAIDDFFRLTTGETPAPGFTRWSSYNLGSLLIEALVALNGQESIVDLYVEAAGALSFETAFKRVYGVDWNYARPILSKTIHANLQEK